MADETLSVDDSMTWDSAYCTSWQNSNLETEESILDCRAIVPEGNEYKIVFISSSSDTDDDWSSSHPTELIEIPEPEEEFVVHLATAETCGSLREQRETGTTELLCCEGSDVAPEISQYEAAGKSSIHADSEPDGKALSVDERIVTRSYDLRASEPVRVTSPNGCGLRAGRLEAEHGDHLELVLSEMDENVTTLPEDSAMDGNGISRKVRSASLDIQDKEIVEISNDECIDLQKLDEVSWTENKEPSTETCNTGLSTLEKYFTFALETGRSNSHKKQPSVALKKPSPPTETYEEDEPSPQSDVINETSESAIEAQDILYHSDSETSVNSDMFSDNEENSSDSSSDEATYIAPASTGISMYSHMSYSLHTIIEESCEESDRGSRSTTPTNSMPPSELEKYFSLTIGRAMQDQKRASLAISEDDSIISDSFSETSGSVYSETNESKNEDIDPAVLAASRLEKYFTFGLLGSGRFCYPDDAEFTDESAGLGSENEDGNMSPSRIRRNSESSLNIPSFDDSGISQSNDNSHSAEITESAFVQDTSYDTVKRKKIKDDKEQEVSNENSDAFYDDSGLSTVKRKKKEDEVSITSITETVDNITSEERTENLDNDSSKIVNSNICLKSQQEETTSLSINVSDKIQIEVPYKNEFSNSSVYSNSEDAYLDSISRLFSENVPESKYNIEIISNESNKSMLQEINSNKCDSIVNNSLTTTETNDLYTVTQTELIKNTDESVKHVKSETQPLSEGYSDDARHIMNKLVAHFTDNNVNTGNAGEFPGWEAFELQIAQLMQTVSPASLSVGDPSGSSCSSSTIGSNNSDYGSDTLESADCTTTDDDEQEQNGRTSALTVNLHPLQRRGSEGSGSGESTDSTISEETIYICKQLVQSLKKMVEATQGDPNKLNQEGDGFSQARIYITEQIVALMHTVSASRNGSPIRERKQNQIDCIPDKSKEVEKHIIHQLSPLTSELSNCSSDEEVDVIFMPNNVNITEKGNCVVPDEPKLDVDLLIVDEGISVDNSDDAQTIGSSSQLCLSESSMDEKQLDSSIILDNNTNFSGKRNFTGNIKVLSPQSDCLTSSLQSGKTKAFVMNNSIESNNKVLVHNLQVESTVFPSVLQTASDNIEGENKDECNLQRSLSDRKKASSESNLLLPDFSAKNKDAKVLATKSTGNISDLEVTTGSKATCRDTGYYSLKSSDDSFLSLDESVQSQTSSASLSRQKSLPSTETILEADEDNCAKQLQVTTVISPKTVSLSSGNIPDTIISATPIKSSTLPSSVRNKVTPTLPPPPSTSRFRPFVSSFFSTSGVLRKLAALRDETSPSHRISPRGKFGGRNRVPSGSEDVRYGMGSMPQLCFQEYAESCSGSTYGSDRASSLLLEEDSDTAFIYPSCSQISLSSFGSRSESMSSVYSAAGGGRYGTVTVTGEVLFGLVYNQKIRTMEIFVKECRNLAPVDLKRNRSDPYVKIYLLPDRTKGGKRKTKVRKHTLNPTFDELLRFNISLSDVEQRTLWLSVWHSDMFGRNDFLGEVLLALGYKAFENTGLRWYPLQERLDTLESPFSFKGDLFLALKYVPADLNNKKYKFPGLFAKGSLHVLMKEARNLMATRSNGTSDPFCKSYLLPDKSKASKQKTSVVKKTSNPKWYHTFIYDGVTLDDLKERCLELTLWDYDKITSNDFLGGVRLSLGIGKSCGKEVDWMDSRCEEVTLWRAMLERPNMWVEGCLLLRPTMQVRRT